MRVTNASTYNLLQSNLSRTTTDLQDLYNTATTGLSLNKASDDPSSITPVLSLRNQIILSERFTNTLGVASDDMDSTDSYLNSIENVFLRASEISVNAINSALNSDDLNSLADEVAQLKEQLLDVANAQIDGEFIFAGYSVTEPPFSENPDYDPELYDQSDSTTWPIIYNGDNNNTTLEIGEGEYLEVNITGNELFLGITNSEWDQEGTIGLQGEGLLSSGTISPSSAGEDITLEIDGNTLTIPASFLTDASGDTNYSATLSNLLEYSPTNLGDLNQISNYTVATPYTLDITNTDFAGNDSTVSVTLDGSAGQEFTLQGMADALAATTGDPAGATSGTLSNGVNWDITTGELLFAAPADSSLTITDDIEYPLEGIAPGESFETGLGTSINAAESNLGSDPASAATTSYDLTITSGGNDVTITGLTPPANTLSDIGGALGSQSLAGDPTALSGTLSNGVSYDLSSGELVFTGNEDGSDLEITITVDNDPLTTNTNTNYGTVDLHTNSTADVTLSGDGLAAAGLTATELDGSTSVDIFGILTNLENSLRAGNLTDDTGTGGGVESALAHLELAADQNRILRSQLGVKASRVEDSINQQALALVDFKSTLSRYEDADITEVFSDITQKETALQATLAVVGKVSDISILDYI